jgi:lysophospholipid acyltransferase (LPLAT)-like uncharacterized protein
MIKQYFKHFLKNSPLIHKLSVHILFLYLKLVYITNRWNFVWPEGMNEVKLNNENGVLLAIWHNRMAFGMYICKNYDNVCALASPHTDGKLITDVIRQMKFNVIEGSTNRNPTEALRCIIKQITAGNKVVITPDGPRGPVYKINSNITRLGYKYNKAIIPISCMATRYFELKSWDKMMIPRNFGEIIVTIGKPLELSGSEEKDNALLETKLMEITSEAKLIIKNNKSR